MFNIKLNNKKTRILNRNAFFAVSLIAFFAVSLLAVAWTASAQIPLPNPHVTKAYISVGPLVVGVGQNATVNAWILPTPTNYAGAAYFGGPNGGGFTGLSVTFTRPDGTKDIFIPTDGINLYPPGVTDALGSIFFYYAPNMAGNWSVTLSMPSSTFTDSTGTVQWTACTSEPASFTVTTEPQNAGLINGYPYAPLPEAYWSYPINSNNREWAAISGDWLSSNYANNLVQGGNGFIWQNYGATPTTGHINWVLPQTAGGLIGGQFGSSSYRVSSNGGITVDQPIILNGKLYINYPTDAGSALQFRCIDLATGKVLWAINGSITFGYHTPGNTYAQGTQIQLASSFGASLVPNIVQSSGGNWNFIDPNTGAVTRTLTNVTASNYEILDGTPYAWGSTLSGGLNYVWKWNLTQVTGNNWQTGIVWRTFLSHPAPGDGSGRTSFAVSADLSTVVYGAGPGSDLAMGFNANTGASIWNLTLPYYSQQGIIQLFNTNSWFGGDPTTSTYYCYSDLTGKLLWTAPNVGTYPWNTKQAGFCIANDNNNLYVPNADGTITALSLTDGHVVWQSTPVPTNEISTNVLPFWRGIVLGKGEIYVFGGYDAYYELNPIPRLEKLESINTTTGATTFTLNGGLYPQALANGYLICLGQYDGNYYCIGKGKTSTTVTVPNSVTEKSTVQIQGNVLDQSPAQPGTPAVSDSSMSEWMDYLHMQNATLLNNPPKEAGVLVTLTAFDPNNNIVPIGTSTTNSAGNFHFDWTPTITGDYTIKASFAGSESYWASTSEASAVVTAASATAPVQTPAPQSMADMYFVPAIAALFVLIVIVAIVLAMLMLRKRP